MKFKVCLKDQTGIGTTHIFDAESMDRGLGDRILEWVDGEYDVDSQTDGADIWYEKEDGEQVILFRIMNIGEEE